MSMEEVNRVDRYETCSVSCDPCDSSIDPFLESMSTQRVTKRLIISSA
jgi:hypothetical protein